jgi:hypothetical protein
MAGLDVTGLQPFASAGERQDKFESLPVAENPRRLNS